MSNHDEDATQGQSLEERIEERRHQVRTDIARLTETTSSLADEVRRNTERNEANERLVRKVADLALRNQVLTIAIILMVLVIGALGWVIKDRSQEIAKLTVLIATYW